MDDWNKLNDLSSNLRIVDARQNCRNRRKNSANTSGLIGVCKRMSDGKYLASIQGREKGKKTFKRLGAFWDKNEAGRVYDAAVRARGSISVCNFPEEHNGGCNVQVLPSLRACIRHDWCC